MASFDDEKALHQWYLDHRRALPWRQSRDPYRIWISETMLQQTTTQVVIPYFEKFMELFPTLEALASAPEAKVLSAWAGLGYYSRARNLHRAAQLLFERGGFPENHLELLNFPGFGPYTARSVASLAFGERVGVLDGNVIRILSRRFGLDIEWWSTGERRRLQALADRYAQKYPSAEMNQAMMELGATVCSAKSPRCGVCPWLTVCEAHKTARIAELPRPRPRRTKEIWVWQADLHRKQGQVLLQKNDYAPFLRNQWFLPGAVQKLRVKPKDYDFKHTITHHEIYVRINRLRPLPKNTEIKWVQESDVSEWVPASLVQKVLSKSQ